MSEIAKAWLVYIGVPAILLIGSIGLLMWVIPVYGVWQQGLSGQASLEKAKQERKILIEQARAEVQAAALRAKAIEIIGASAKKYPEYRLQEFIGAFGKALEDGKINQIIYVPTEANIPVLEAGKRRSTQ